MAIDDADASTVGDGKLRISLRSVLRLREMLCQPDGRWYVHLRRSQRVASK